MTDAERKVLVILAALAVRFAVDEIDRLEAASQGDEATTTLREMMDGLGDAMREAGREWRASETPAP